MDNQIQNNEEVADFRQIQTEPIQAPVEQQPSPQASLEIKRPAVAIAISVAILIIVLAALYYFLNSANRQAPVPPVLMGAPNSPTTNQ